MKRFAYLILTGFVAMGIGAAPATAQTIIEYVFEDNTNGTLTCSAGDIASVTATVLNGITECELGDTVALELELDIVMNTNERFDFGIYTATDGGDAMTGQCALNVAPNAAPFADVDGDDCGDVNSNVLNDFALAPINVPCVDDDGNGFLDFPSCFSWRVPGSNEVCGGPDDVYPNPGSKCDCSNVQIDAIAVPGKIEVTKTANPDTMAMPGGVVTFSVSVLNNSGNGVDVTIDTLNDSVFGDIADNMNAAILSTTCSLNQVITDGNSYNCQFTANISSNHTDTVTASGTDTNGNPVSDMDDAEVVIVNCLMDTDCNDSDPCTIDTCIAEPMGCGDADSNGGVSASDALNILRAATGLSSECTIARCDVDASGAITASDALRVLRSSIGIASAMACAPQCDNAPMVCQDDGLFCNGEEVCVEGMCESEGDPCDGNARCTDVCEEDTDTCGAGNVPATDETCDGFDDDCDGTNDEDFMSQPTQCGTGECAADGMTQCVNGMETDTCMPGAPGTGDMCDGLDNDCDGQVDEDFMSQPTMCGIGECAADGMTQCDNGQVVDTCEEGMPGNGDMCDGLDNDCDGQIDEDFIPQQTMCGMGECAANGVTVCTGGQVQDTCEAGMPGDGDPCDGLDNDCDGEVDEDFMPQPTECGAGSCSMAGMTQCVNGMIGDTCMVGDPISDTDETCDGVDDDCDGMIDEDFMPEPTNCGEGVCAAMGQTTCEMGQVGDTCVPGNPISNTDETCDAVDDDCDGTDDEDFMSQPTMCGEGECAADGMTQCEAGQVVDTCEAGMPGDGDLCDGLDNDCDGMIDEDHQVVKCASGECRSGDLECTNGSTSCVITVADEGIPCFDGLFCTEQDQCDANGRCVGVPVETTDRLKFEDHLEGQIVAMTSGELGTGPVAVNGFNPNLGAGVNAAVIFDSDCVGGCTGNDHDLGTPNEEFGGPGIGEGGGSGAAVLNDVSQSFVLIIAKNVKDMDGDTLVDDPNDQSFSVVTNSFDFSAIAPVVVHDLVVIDIEADEAPGAVDLFDEIGDLITSVPLPATAGDNGVLTVDLGDVEGVWFMDVTLNGSGAIDDISYTTGQCEELVPN